MAGEGQGRAGSGLVRRSGAIVLLAACLTLPLARAARAQQQELNFDASVNYVYAAQLGFGGYRVGGLSVQVYSLPIERTLHDVFLDWRLRVAFPILYGDYDLDATQELQGVPYRLRVDQRTLSAEPKLKLEIPLTERWTASLIGAWGFGSSFDTRVRLRIANYPSFRLRQFEQSTWYYTYQVGVSSLFQEKVGRWTLSLGNAFIYAGTADLETDAAEGGEVQAYGALETGVEARHPLGLRVSGYAPDASLFFIWYYFAPALEFTRVGRALLQVDHLYEVGLTFGADPETPFRIPLLGNPRLGVSYRVGTDLDAVRLNFGFPF